MMARFISEKLVKARKLHHCSSYMILESEVYNGSDVIKSMSFAEKRVFVNARINRGAINPGEYYIRQTCEADGSIYTTELRPELHDICIKYRLYNQE